MKNTQTICDPATIEQFLQEQLSDGEQSEFERHLDDCVDCRQQLESTAAGVEIWSEVRESLLGGAAQTGSVTVERRVEGRVTFETGVDSAAGNDSEFGHSAVLNLLAPTDDERMLGRLGTYEVAGVIGSGGMGVVLKAFDSALNRNVAIKVLAPHLGSSGAARKRFSREAQAAAAVVHDNVIEIHGVADIGGLPYLVMPYVPGPSLQRRLDQQGALGPVEVLRIGMQAATGLAAAHAQGLVHRDVKPANILLADGVERVKLTDFGLARAADDSSLTKTGIIAGTPQYMSPEQARGETVGQRSDLFSLGAVLYAMCTGRAPFRAETSYGVLRRITDEEPRPIREINPDVPEWLCEIVRRLMSKQAEDRFESAREVAELLEECLAHVQQPVSVPLPPSLVTKPPRRRITPKWLAGLAGIVATLSLGVLGLPFLPGQDAPDISGQWEGEGWGAVELKETKPDEYEGTYTDTFKRKPGQISVKWNPKERRFNGVWGEGKNRTGTISVRLVGRQIQGAWTTSKDSLIDPGSPNLADLIWQRPKKSAAKGSGPSKIEGHVLAIEKGVVELSIGLDDGLRNGMKLTVVRGQNSAGTVEVIRLKAGSSVARILESLVDAPVRKGDRVVVTGPGLPQYEATGDPNAQRSPKFEPKVVLRIRTRGVRALAWSPDGQTLAVGGGPTSLQLYDAGAGTLRAAIRLLSKEHEAIFAADKQVSQTGVRSIAFSPDSSMVAVGSSNGQVKLFDTRTGVMIRALDDLEEEGTTGELASPILELPLAHGHVWGVAFSPDGRLLATCGEPVDFRRDGVERGGLAGPDSGLLKIWDVKTGERKIDLKGGHNSLVTGVAFSPDGKMLASAGYWWDGPNTSGNGAKVWDPLTGKKLTEILIPKNRNPFSIGFSPDGEQLVIGVVHHRNEDNVIRGSINIVNVRDVAVDLSWPVPQSARPVAFSPDGEMVAALSDGNALTLWNSTTGLPESEFKSRRSSGESWKHFALSPDGNSLAIGGVDSKKQGFVEVWAIRDRRANLEAKNLPQPLSKPLDARTLRFSIDDRVRKIATSPDGKLIAIGNGPPTQIMRSNGASRARRSWRPSVEILEATTGKTIVSLKLSTPAEDKVIAETEKVSHFELRALDFSPDGTLLAVGTSIGQVKLFDVRTWKVVRSFDDKKAKLADEKTPENWMSLDRAMGGVVALTFSPDGKQLAVCGVSFADFARSFDRISRLTRSVTGPGRVKVWDVASGKMNYDLAGHDSHVNDVAFSPDGSMLATAGNWLTPDDWGTGVILWSAHTGSEIRRFETTANGGTNSIAFSPDNQSLAIGTQRFDNSNSKAPSSGGVSLVQVSSGTVGWLVSVPGWARSVDFLPDGKSVAVLCGGRSVRFLGTATGSVQHEIRQTDSESGLWWDIDITPQGHRLAICGSGRDRKGGVEVRDLTGLGLEGNSSSDKASRN
jgi:serine/threonine protein kinase/WD40 repeat protein